MVVSHQWTGFTHFGIIHAAQALVAATKWGCTTPILYATQLWLAEQAALDKFLYIGWQIPGNHDSLNANVFESFVI